MHLSSPLDFQPDAATLAAVLAELEALGDAGGGAVAAAVRRAALGAFERFGPELDAPQGRRHDYGALGYDNLLWSTGRVDVPALPKFVPGRADDEDAPALADANVGGLVHAGSTYLAPAERTTDSRVTLSSLADEQRADPARVAAIHGRIVAPQTDRFTALATAFQNCGAFVDIPAGIALGAPLQIVWSTQPGEPRAVFPHTVVRVGTGARATIVERHVGTNETFLCGIVEIDLAPNAQLDYAIVQRADEGSRLLLRRAARCAAGARLGWHGADLGGALARSAYSAQLRGARARADTSAFFFADGFADVDLAVALDHAAGATVSETVVRGAAADRARGRFAGAIRIPNVAAHCEATLRADGLVLSRDAFLEARSALEVATSDVAAFNATAVGSLDEERLFYVQSRGIARSAAARMIALAFFEPAIARFPGHALRDEVRTALDARLDEVPDTFAS